MAGRVREVSPPGEGRLVADLRPGAPLVGRGAPGHRTSAAAAPGASLALAAPHCRAEGDPGPGGQS
jgi:hypothetical protein